MDETETSAVVVLRGAAKQFGPVRARDGECLGLVGHNGAEKSTLVNLINGTFGPSSGRVDLPGGTAGVRSVIQDLSLCPNLTVAKNLAMAHPALNRTAWRTPARSEIRKTLETLFPSHRIDPDAEFDTLSIAEGQKVEIAIGFAPHGGAARMVILDEPTNALDEGISGQLRTHVCAFCHGSGAVILISHMLGEVFDVSSRIIVLKDGKVVADRPSEEFTRAGLARLYLSLSSDWRRGTGARAVFVAGDRPRDGVLLLWSILRTVSLSVLGRVLVDRVAERSRAEDWRKRIGIRTDDLGSPILSLSGGNQQKVLFARALAPDAPIVVMDDPMPGVDVGTKQDVYAMIRA